MNLTRMRHFEWDQFLEPIIEEYKGKIPWGDQDIINIIFSYHPGKECFKRPYSETRARKMHARESELSVSHWLFIFIQPICE